VVIAFAILAVVVAAVLQGVGGGLRAAGRAEDRVAALLAARSLLDRVGADIPVRPGTLSGAAGEGAWTIRIRPWRGAPPGAAAPVALYEVEVSVADRARLPLVLTTLRLGPAPGP
jgi:hypothetical protein